jgi:hypothetical protein
MRISTLLLSCWISVVSIFATPVSAAEQRCPPRLPGEHAGFTQVGPVPTAHWLLWRMRLFDGSPDQTKQREYAPDDTIETRDGLLLVWRFRLPENFLMVCLYNGSGTYYVARRQAPAGRCIMNDDNGLTQAWCD